MKIKLSVVLFLLVMPAFAWLIQPGYFSMHDDLQAARQLQMDKCFSDFQIPCRWVPDMGYGFGYPLFNFYPPLPYLIGQPFVWLGFQYINVIKIVGILGFVFCAYTMYLLGRQFWGNRGGLLASLVYTYAPYHSVDFYVRGAMNEFWAMALFPLIFWSAYRLILTPSPKVGEGRGEVWKWIALLSLSFSLLMLSHNLMLMIFTPVLVVWCLFWIFKLRAFKRFGVLAISAVWSLGLSAFFTLPVLFESKYAHVETLTIGYFNFLAHFLDLKQIFLRINWGYGESILGSGDTMSFALGYLQWIIPLIVLLAMFVNKNLKKNYSIFLLFAFFILISLFFSHSKSTPFWLKFPPLQFLQFPWRLLTLAVFSASFLSGAFVLINSKYSKLIFLYSFTLLLLLNANYFRPREWYPNMTDQEKFSGKSWQWQITGSIFDYLPIYAPLPPADPAGGDMGITSGQGTYSRIVKRTNYQKYLVNITSPSAVAELQTFYFPGWRVWLNGQEVKIDPARDPLLGRMQIDIPFGQHILIARFTNTPVRTFSNTLSLISWTLLIILPIYQKKHKPLLTNDHKNS